MKAFFERVAPVAARRAVAHDVDAEVLDAVEHLVVEHLRARGASDQASVQASVQ